MKAPRTQLILIRHGSSISGERRAVGGHRGCQGLAPLGVNQVVRLGWQLFDLGVRPDLIYTSSLRRSRQSATILSSILNIPVYPPACLFCELHPGAVDGRSFVELGPSPRVVDEAAPLASGGESQLQLRERGARALAMLERTHRGQKVGLVSHAGLIRTVCQAALLESDEASSNTFMPEASVIVLGKTKTAWRRLSLGRS